MKIKIFVIASLLINLHAICMKDNTNSSQPQTSTKPVIKVLKKEQADATTIAIIKAGLDEWRMERTLVYELKKMERPNF